MKLTYENCDRLRLTNMGNLRDRNSTHNFMYNSGCKVCVEPFLGEKHALYCCNSCSRLGTDNGNYKGGVKKIGIPLYDTYGPKMILFEKVRIYMLRVGCIVYKTLQVKCHESGCRKWFRPTLEQVRSRLKVFNGIRNGQADFYCSERCKVVCPTYAQKKYFRGQKRPIRTYSDQELHVWSREVLRKSNFVCACCGEPATIGHHIKSKIEYPEFALDPNNGIALCKLCHHQVFHTGKNNPNNYIDKCRKLKTLLKN